MKLSELQRRLAVLMGEAMARGDEDPEVMMFDRYGGHRAIDDVRLDWVPWNMEEAESDVRHPVVEFLPIFELPGG